MVKTRKIIPSYAIEKADIFKSDLAIIVSGGRTNKRMSIYEMDKYSRLPMSDCTLEYGAWSKFSTDLYCVVCKTRSSRTNETYNTWYYTFDLEHLCPSEKCYNFLIFKYANKA